MHDNRTALTLKRPWPLAIARLGKDVENRTWSTSYRGPLWIHAGKAWDASAIPWMESKGLLTPDFPRDDSEHPSGVLVASCELVGVRTAVTSRWWNGAGYAWMLRDAREIPHEPVRGAQGLWIVGNQLKTTGPGAGHEPRKLRFKIEYTDAGEPGTANVWAYDSDHAEEKFLSGFEEEGGNEGVEIKSITRRK